MTIREFDTEIELEDAAEKLEELCFEHLYLRQEVEDRRRELELAEKELLDFKTDNPEIL